MYKHFTSFLYRAIKQNSPLARCKQPIPKKTVNFTPTIFHQTPITKKIGIDPKVNPYIN